MLTAIILAISPFIVSGVTGLIKMLPAFAEIETSRTLVIRALAAGVSLLYVGLGFWIAPNTVNTDTLTIAIQTFGYAFAAWLSSLGVYHAFFQKVSPQ